MSLLSSLTPLFAPIKAGTIRIVIPLAFVALFSFVTAYASTDTTTSLIILPPANKTGSPALDWLSIGIQDTMTVNLWGVSNAKARAITEYGSLMSYNLGRMSALGSEAAVKLAQEAKVDLVWRGEYELVDTDVISLTYWAVDAKTGVMLQKKEIRGPLEGAGSIVSQMTISLLAASGIKVPDQVIARIAKPVTMSIKAFEQNALGFGRQLQLFGKRGSMMTDKRAWVDQCQQAVLIDPEYAEAYVNLGWALYSIGSSDAALKAFSTAVKFKPYLLDGWMGLGYLQRDRGNNGLALDAFQKAVAINGHLDWPQEELKKIIVTTVSLPGPVAPKPPAAATSPEKREDTLSDDEKKLLTLVEKESLEIRLPAIKSYARSKGVQALPFLKRMIDRPDQAFEVLKLIVDIDITEATPYLIEALVKRITPDGSRLSGLTEQNILGVVQLIKNRAMHQAAPVLILTLADKSAAVRESAALTLGDLGKQEAVEPLRKFTVTERNSRTRVSALVALVKLGDAGSREKLKTLFGDGKDMNAINYATKLMKQRNIRIGD